MTRELRSTFCATGRSFGVEPTNRHDSVKLRLLQMMVLQLAIWGAWARLLVTRAASRTKSLLLYKERPEPWLEALLACTPRMLAITAFAKKLARKRPADSLVWMAVARLCLPYDWSISLVLKRHEVIESAGSERGDTLRPIE